MPVWHESSRSFRKAGTLQVIGVTQEQHADRCELFAAWKGVDWPILWDPFNLTGTKVVPRATFIDEHGIVRAVNARPEALAGFMAQTFAAPDTPAPDEPEVRARLIEAERATAGSPAYRWYDGLSALLWPDGRDGERAMLDLIAHGAANPDDAAVQWRLGVAYRMRYDSVERHEGDFQAALDHWRRGLALDARHYIYRRRIQQYGPRLDKPYPFYPWVEEARKALGTRAPKLRAQLTGSERAGRAPRVEDVSAPGAKEPDPAGAIEAVPHLLEHESAVAWHTGPQAGDAARIHVQIRPAGRRVVLWDAEAGPVTLWFDLPQGWTTPTPRMEHVLRGADKAGEEVAVDFEVRIPPGAPTHGTIRGYALYYACLDGPGECRYLRYDLTIVVPARK